MEAISPDSDSLHHVILYTAQRRPLLEGEALGFAQTALKNLPYRYPGLRIVKQEIHPDRVEMVLDFQRLDEDLSRVVQSFKFEVKNLARKKHPNGDSFWQWTTEEK
jgi:REP element-mobilizing transposase RayT